MLESSSMENHARMVTVVKPDIQSDYKVVPAKSYFKVYVRGHSFPYYLSNEAGLVFKLLRDNPEKMFSLQEICDHVTNVRAWECDDVRIIDVGESNFAEIVTDLSKKGYKFSSLTLNRKNGVYPNHICARKTIKKEFYTHNLRHAIMVIRREIPLVKQRWDIKTIHSMGYAFVWLN